jgi:SAM-dependent methyltransferase
MRHRSPGVAAALTCAAERLRQRVVGLCRDDDFYAQTLRQLLSAGVLRRDMRVLVACGGDLDRDVLSGLGFQNVTFSNLDLRLAADQFAPFAWANQDVEALTFSAGDFDFAIVHNGLHHCHSPHKALLELYRVARTGVLVFEPRDSALVRLGIRLGLGQRYEVASVSHNGLSAGGVANSQIPNFIYRWSEREVEKTILSFAPYGEPRFQYLYALRVPWGRLLGLKNPMLLFGVLAGLPLLKLFFSIFPRQTNGFAFLIRKPTFPRDLHPWLRLTGDGVAVRDEWIEDRYLVAK